MESIRKQLVSVIIPTYNAALFIEETISSILSQTIPDFEIIVIDDASSDNTVQVIKKIAKEDSRIKYFIQEKGGVSIARNKGIKESAAQFIAFIDHDDLWMPQKLEKQLKVFNNDPQLGLVFSRESIITADGRPIGISGGISRLSRGYVFKDLFCRHFISPSTVLIRREVFDTLDEWFDESMEMAEEVDLFLRIAYKWKVDYCDEVLAKWRVHSNNDSSLRRNLLVSDYKHILEKLKLKIPDFDKKYRKEIFKKQRWIAMAEIEVLILEKNRELAASNFFVFLRKFGLNPKAIIKFFILFSIGFNNYEKIRRHLIALYNKLFNRFLYE